MSLSSDKRARISEEAKKILLKRLENFPDNANSIRNAPFHKAFLECFKDRIKPLNIELPYLIAIASWLHGLNTSLGSGFENLAHILSGGYKRSFTGNFNLKVKASQASEIERIVVELKSKRNRPDLIGENGRIFTFEHNDKEVDALGFTVDNYVEYSNVVEAIELKSVRPNSGEVRGEKQKILYGKAALKLLNPDKNVNFYLGFPFDPTSNTPTGHNKERFFNYLIEFKKYFSCDEVLIGNELWDHLSGSKNTMEEILEVIAETVKMVKE